MNILLWLAYKGTNYSGFQVQPNGVTVCAVVQDAMQSVFGTRPDVKGCSRTDTGVHVLHDQPAVFLNSCKFFSGSQGLSRKP